MRTPLPAESSRAGGGVDPEAAAAAWIVLFALSRNPRDFSLVTNCQPGRSAPALASQIAPYSLA